jgi:hypothetical protein
VGVCVGRGGVSERAMQKQPTPANARLTRRMSLASLLADMLGRVGWREGVSEREKKEFSGWWGSASVGVSSQHLGAWLGGCLRAGVVWIVGRLRGTHTNATRHATWPCDAAPHPRGGRKRPAEPAFRPGLACAKEAQ